MSAITQETIDMMEILPESEQTLINEFVKRIVLAWDSDFTKVTPTEMEDIIQAEKDYAAGEVISHEDINWN